MKQSTHKCPVQASMARNATDTRSDQGFELQPAASPGGLDRGFLELFSFLSHYHWIHDLHLTQFFESRVWDHMPAEWIETLTAMSVEELNGLPFQSNEDKQTGRHLGDSLTSFLHEASRLGGCRWRASGAPPPPTPVSNDLRKGMSAKKLHEVERMASLVHQVAVESGCNVVVDVGSGLGYLGQVLHKSYGLSVIGLESSEGHSDGAEKRAAKQGLRCSGMRSVPFRISQEEGSVQAFRSLVSGIAATIQPCAHSSPASAASCSQPCSAESPRARPLSEASAPAGKQHAASLCVSRVPEEPASADSSRSCQVCQQLAVTNRVHTTCPEVKNHVDTTHSKVTNGVRATHSEVKNCVHTTHPQVTKSVHSTHSEVTNSVDTTHRQVKNCAHMTHLQGKTLTGSGDTQDQSVPGRSASQESDEPTATATAQPTPKNPSPHTSSLQRERHRQDRATVGNYHHPHPHPHTHPFLPPGDPQLASCESKTHEMTAGFSSSPPQHEREEKEREEERGGGVAEGLRVCVVGLHCCGDLTPAVLRLFRAVDFLQALCCVSCCYHKMQPAPGLGQFTNFPMSRAASRAYAEAQQQLSPLLSSSSSTSSSSSSSPSASSSSGSEVPGFFYLTPCSLRLAAQETRARWAEQTEEEHDRHMRHVAYRAILELLIKDSGLRTVDRKSIRKLDYRTFDQFVQSYMAVANIKEEEQKQTTENRLKVLYEDCGKYFPLVEPYTCLQVAMQPVLEWAVLRDRQRWLEEEGLTSDLSPVFDEHLSPRNLALVSVKSRPAGDEHQPHARIEHHLSL
ncbi:uncharacterized protein LOC143277871 [Babylonia areolata]|uniref:uncharacterized protein LOC143277871 n=1 Tax=Babylonia areolata TaxID=304850 RepID=UPI003FD509E8